MSKTQWITKDKDWTFTIAKSCTFTTRNWNDIAKNYRLTILTRHTSVRKRIDIVAWKGKLTIRKNPHRPFHVSNLISRPKTIHKHGFSQRQDSILTPQTISFNPKSDVAQEPGFRNRDEFFQWRHIGWNVIIRLITAKKHPRLIRLLSWLCCMDNRLSYIWCELKINIRTVLLRIFS